MYDDENVPKIALQVDINWSLAPEAPSPDDADKDRIVSTNCRLQKYDYKNGMRKFDVRIVQR